MASQVVRVVDALWSSVRELSIEVGMLYYVGKAELRVVLSFGHPAIAKKNVSVPLGSSTVIKFTIMLVFSNRKEKLSQRNL